MKTDTYTKIVLTIIAVCLMVISFNILDIFPKAYAQTSNAPVRVEVVGISGSIFNSLPVRVEAVNSSTRPLPVKIEDVNSSTRSLRVRIEDVNRTVTPLPVRMN